MTFLMGLLRVGQSISRLREITLEVAYYILPLVPRHFHRLYLLRQTSSPVPSHSVPFLACLGALATPFRPDVSVYSTVSVARAPRLYLSPTLICLL